MDSHLFALLGTILLYAVAVSTSREQGNSRRYAQFPREMEQVLSIRYPGEPQDQPVHIPHLYCTFQLHVITFFLKCSVLQCHLHRLGPTIRLELILECNIL